MADVTKITLPNGTTKNIKDAIVRAQANWNTNNGVKNLLNFDADTMKSVNTGGTWSGNTWSLGNNVTLTINSDKSITLNGTANAGKTVYLTKNLGMAENAYTLSTGALTTKLWAGMIEVGGTENNYTGSTTHLDKTCQPNHITLYVESGCTLSNFTIYPMLTLKSLYDADSTYEPYALPNTKITPELIELVDSGAKNICNTSLDLLNPCAVTFTLNSDKSVTLNGTSTASVPMIPYRFDEVILEPNKQYICKGTNNSNVHVQVLGYTSESSYSLLANSDTDVEFNSGNWSKWIIRCWISAKPSSGTQFNNVTIYPMICTKAAWDVSQKYVPYAPTNAELYEMIKALQT